MGVSPVEGSGLAYLVHADPGKVPSKRDSPCHEGLADLANYVFDLKPSAEYQEGSSFYQDLQARIEQRAQACTSAASEPGPSTSQQTTPEPPGRLGPSAVTIDRSSVVGSYSYSGDGLLLESLGNFSSCRANVAVFKGKWQYEATVLTPGIQQIGWATIHCPFTVEEGVGDAPDSYAIDGKRVRKWSVKPQPYGKSWVQGDVIGCLIDLDAATISFSRNGVDLGVAYSRVRTMQPHLAYFPALSLSHAERCHVNFGARPFAYPIEGYQPLQAPPPAAERAEASYYCSCMERLALMAFGAGASNEPDAVAVMQQGPGLSGPAIHPTTGVAVANSTSTQAGTAAASQGDSFAPGRRSSSSCFGSACSDLSAATTPHATSTPSAAACEALFPRALLSKAEMVLLAACAARPLQLLLRSSSYLVHSTLLPLLQELHRTCEPHRPHLLRAAVQLLELVMDGKAFKQAMRIILEALAVKCQISPLCVDDFPYTAAYPHLALACALLQLPSLRALWLSDPDFYLITEGLLTRKAPSGDDLKLLLPHVWWKGNTDETCSEERLRASMSSITSTLAKVEERQYELICLLACSPPPMPSVTTRTVLSWTAAPAGAEQPARPEQQQQPPRISGLLVFLRFLLQKNRGALRDIPPPGLSDATVLMSAFFAFLRLLQPALKAAGQGQGPLAAFPAAQILATGSPPAEAEVVHELPRLGGVISHLLREVPLNPEDKGPLAVSGPPPLNSNSPDPAVEVPEAVVPELLNACMLLYCWRVGLSLKMLHNLSGVLAGNIAKLADVERVVAAQQELDPGGGQSMQWLMESRNFYRDELIRDVRLLTLLRIAFFSPPKQEQLCVLGSYMSSLLLKASERGQLLAYMPTAYVELVVDFCMAFRRVDATFATPAQLAGHGAQQMVSLLTLTMNNSSICNPDVKESLLQCTCALLEAKEWRALFEVNPVVQQHLMPSLLAVFDGRLWHPASNLLLRVIRESGFGQRCDPGSLLCPLQQQLKAQCQLGQPHVSGFLNRLFSTLNWTLTEFTSSISELHQQRSSSRLQLEAQQKYRRTILMFELSVNLLRILEFVVVQGPTMFLEGPPVNRDRLMELLQFVLAHFTTGPGARCLNALLQQGSSLPAGSSSSSAAAGAAGTGRGRVAGGAGGGGGGSNGTGGGAGSSSSGGASSSSPAPAPQLPPQAGEASTAAGSSNASGSTAAAAGGAGSNSGGASTSFGGTTAAVARPGPAAVAVDQLRAAAAQVVVENGVGAAAAGSSRPHGAGGDAGGSRLGKDLLSLRVEKAAILAPVMGILLGLWDGGDKGLERMQQHGTVGSSSLLAELGAAADEKLVEKLKFMQDLDWCSAFPSVPLSEQLRHYEQLVELVKAAHAANAAAVAAAAAAGKSTAEVEVPDDFLDPITMVLMTDPVKLPDSQIIVDRSTIERHLMNASTDPFSRSPLTMAQVQPQEELMERIKEWQQSHVF